MKKVLVNAYAVAPDWGSEPGMGWNWCSGLARECELFVITEGEFRNRIEEALRNHPCADHLHFYYLPVSERIRKMCWNQGDWRFYVHYRHWQKRALELARSICEKESIDVIHQLNMIGFREPGYLWKIPEIPYVLGPVNCKFEYPSAYWKDAPLKERLKIRAKDLISRLQIRFSYRIHRAVERACAVITANSDSQHLFKKYLGVDSLMINETGTDPVSFSRTIADSDTMNVLWVGRLNLYTKLPGLAIQALASARNPRLRLHFVGPGQDGPYRSLAERLGVSDQCIWHGPVPHREVLTLMRQMDLFFLTSIVEGTPHVVLEAISNGLPVLCFDTCGQGDVVDDHIGIKIPVTNPENSAEDFARALNELSLHPDRLHTLSESCRSRLEELSWEKRFRRVVQLYETILKES